MYIAISWNPFPDYRLFDTWYSLQSVWSTEFKPSYLLIRNNSDESYWLLKWGIFCDWFAEDDYERMINDQAANGLIIKILILLH